MDFQKLYTMQSNLDAHIEEKHDLQEEDLFDRKLLALLVELGELANETRCFKFWSLKAPSEKKIILEEFVDGIHFILSIGNEVGFMYRQTEVEIPECTASEQFLEVYEAISRFRHSRSETDYRVMFQTYLALASLLGLSSSEIEKAYMEKNEVNFDRQEKGY
ncbi:dUTP diphosphatase [Bacillus sp. B15-48]|uniref:dUTP diphosphatase n=1 Tax=Bacillus sp. B15-48 TaxID=1548601 RepID=UPI00193F1726|nr:dUTP diphosphatase [Bacillus sp. B15-48]MBM4762508.1 dUTPase [Bacillus sp. B15-48]